MMRYLHVAMVAVFMLASILAVHAYASVISIKIAPSVAPNVVWMPCNGTLLPYQQFVYAVPPGYNVSIVGVHVDYERVSQPLRLEKALVLPFLYNATPLETTCKSIVIQVGRWRGVTLVDVLLAVYTSEDKRLANAEILLDVKRVGSETPLDPWTYRIVESIATRLYPRGWSVSATPYSIGIIVVTRKVLLPAVNEWAAYKRLQGYVVTVLTLEDICEKYGNIVKSFGVRAAIRKAVKDIYESAPKIYRYLVIVGDDSGQHWGTRITSCTMLAPWEVPTAYFYNPATQYDLQSSHSGYYVPSDIYYVTFDGDWDANGNGVLGEYPQDVREYDPYPELLPVRIPVRDITAARAALSTLTFNTGTGDYAVLAGAILYYPGEGGENGLESQGDTLLEGLYQQKLSTLGWIKTIKLYEHYPASAPVTSPSMLNGNLTFTNIVTVLQDVRGLVTIMSHGSVDCVWRKIWVNDTNGNGIPDRGEVSYKPFLCAANAYGLQPQLLYVVGACLTAYYDNPTSTSLGEALVRKGSGYIGWNRITFVPLLPPEEELNPEYWCCTPRLIYFFYRELLSQDSVERFGDALLKAIVEYATAEPLAQDGIMGNVSRRVFFSLTAMMDPTRMAYSLPTMFSSTHLVIPAKPGEAAVVNLRLETIASKQPVRHQPVYAYVYHGGYNISKYPLLSVYTGDDGSLTFTVTVGAEGLKLLLYYPGSNRPPTPYEPTTSIVVLNTSIAPWVVATPSSISTLSWLRIYGCGFPAYAPLDVLVEGVKVTRIYSNSTGCFDVRISLPYTLPLGPVNLTVVDAEYPAISATTSIVISSNLMVEQARELQRLSASLSSILDILRQVAMTLQKLRAGVEALNESVEQGYENLYESIASLHLKLSSIAVELDKLHNVLETLDSNIQYVRTVGVNVYELLKNVNMTIGALDVQVDKLRTRLEALEAKAAYLDQLRSELRNIEERISGIRGELYSLLSKLQEKLGGLELRLEALNKSYQMLVSKTTSIDMQLLNVSTLLYEMKAKLESRLGSINESIAKLGAKLVEISSSIREAREDIKTLESRIVALHEEVSTLKVQVGNLSKMQELISLLTVSIAGVAATIGAYIAARRA